MFIFIKLPFTLSYFSPLSEVNSGTSGINLGVERAHSQFDNSKKEASSGR
jgi:hypothetical protein